MEVLFCSRNYKYKHMKKNFILSLIIFSILISINACKKSENDPFLPFSSRDTRISKIWKLSSLSSTENITRTSGSIEIITDIKYEFDGTNMTKTTVTNEGTEVDEKTYSRTLEIKKDGFYSDIISYGEENSEYNGYWFWQDGNKKKIGIKFSESEAYIINRLANDELILNFIYLETKLENNIIVTTEKEQILTFSN